MINPKLRHNLAPLFGITSAMAKAALLPQHDHSSEHCLITNPLPTFVSKALALMGKHDYGAAKSHPVLHESIMAEKGVPHFHNEPGVPVVRVGSHEFMCVGAKPPFDHPHVFLDMGSSDEIICPYCSSLFKYDVALKTGDCMPAECLLDEAGKPARAA
jgi:uncharacterized Zn-finger protein